jgi:endoglucanase
MKMRMSVLRALLALTATFAVTASADNRFAGVNLSGAEFGVAGRTLPGTYNTDYIYPNSAEVDYYRGRGMNIIRLPFRWERLQPTNQAALDPTELGRMSALVSYATANGLYVILDPHNFQRYWPDTSSFNTMQSGSQGLVGGALVPNAAFSNFWYQVANIFRANDRVIFGLMNEPNAVPEDQMVASLNAAIAGIRASGATNMIFVPGNRWDGAWTWSSGPDAQGAANAVALLGIVDPGSNCVFEVHQYLDSDGSGSRTNIASATIGVERLTNFTAWARSHQGKGFLGEFAVPGAAIGGTNLGGSALTNMLSYIRTNSDVWLGWTYWGGGPWWGSNPLFPIEPLDINNPVDQPTMTAIRPFIPVNHPPVMAPVTAWTAQNTVLNLQTAKLLERASDPDGDPLSIVAVSATSTNGGQVVLGSGTITYLPVTNFLGLDQFSFTISDGRGGFLTNTVVVTVSEMGPGVAGQLAGGLFTATLFGVPGWSYTIEYRTNMAEMFWLWRTNVTAGSNAPGMGQMVITEGVTDFVSRFYRAVYPARAGTYPASRAWQHEWSHDGW